ncbi:MAG: hypothetical protein R2880_09735 [Deinococcales bacterium]
MPLAVNVSRLRLAERYILGQKLLILDEPTSALSVGETNKVLEYIRNAKAKGLGLSSSLTMSLM